MHGAKTVLKSLVAAVAMAACTTTTGPGDGTAPPPPPPAQDIIQRVTLQITEIEVTGSCDYDSFLQDNKDGEFDFRVSLLPDGSNEVVLLNEQQKVYEENRTHDLRGRNLRTTFNRNVTRGEGFTLQATASEWDGLFRDGDFDRWTVTNGYTWNGSSWMPTTRRFRFDPAKGDCGVFIRYDITSTQN